MMMNQQRGHSDQGREDYLLSLLRQREQYHAWIRSITAIGVVLLTLALLYLPILIFTDVRVSGTIFGVLLIVCPFLCTGAVFAAPHIEGYVRVERQIKQAMVEYIRVRPSPCEECDTTPSLIEATITELPPPPTD